MENGGKEFVRQICLNFPWHQINTHRSKRNERINEMVIGNKNHHLQWKYSVLKREARVVQEICFSHGYKLLIMIWTLGKSWLM